MTSTKWYLALLLALLFTFSSFGGITAQEVDAVPTATVREGGEPTEVAPAATPTPQKSQPPEVSASPTASADTQAGGAPTASPTPQASPAAPTVQPSQLDAGAGEVPSPSPEITRAAEPTPIAQGNQEPTPSPTAPDSQVPTPAPTAQDGQEPTLAPTPTPAVYGEGDFYLLRARRASADGQALSGRAVLESSRDGRHWQRVAHPRQAGEDYALPLSFAAAAEDAQARFAL